MLSYARGTFPYAHIEANDPGFVAKVMLEPRVAALKEFQQYLISKGHKIKYNHQLQKKITKSKNPTLLVNYYQQGIHKGKTFDHVYRVDPQYCWHFRYSSINTHYHNLWMQQKGLIDENNRKIKPEEGGN